MCIFLCCCSVKREGKRPRRHGVSELSPPTYMGTSQNSKPRNSSLFRDLKSIQLCPQCWYICMRAFHVCLYLRVSAERLCIHVSFSIWIGCNKKNRREKMRFDTYLSPHFGVRTPARRFRCWTFFSDHIYLQRLFVSVFSFSFAKHLGGSQKSTLRHCLPPS